MVRELVRLVEFHRPRVFIGFDFAGIEGLAVVIGRRSVLGQRSIGPCHRVTDADLERLRLMADALYVNCDRLGSGGTDFYQAGQ